MKSSVKKIVIGLTLLTSFFTSCKKGDTGATGPKGTAGNANVVVYSLPVTTWNLSANGKYWYITDNFGVPLNFNAAASAVMVYWQNKDSNYVAMPITMSDIQYSFQYSTSNTGENIIEVDVSSASGNTTVPNPGQTKFKIVIIPPAMIKPNINQHNYEEVKIAYGL
jgi:hypothetical protein